MKKSRRLSAANLLLSMALLSPAAANAAALQEPAAPQTGSYTKRVTASGVGVATAECADECGVSSAALNFFAFPESELWLVGGQDNRSYDIGLKYLKGRNLFRGTLEADNTGKSVSAGADWDLFLRSYRAMDISLLGDISTVKREGSEERFADFGIGTKLAFARGHNAFFLYSNRGHDNESDYRFGYMFWKDKEMLASVLMDYAKGRKPAFHGYLGLNRHRFDGSYDIETGRAASISIITFGNRPLPDYATKGWFASQNILTKRSVSDSDWRQFFQTPFFVDPAGRIGDVLRFNIFYDPNSGTGVLAYNALMIRTSNRKGIVLTQNWDRIGGENFYGGGIGYSFGYVTPVVIYQGGSGRRLGVDVNYSF